MGFAFQFIETGSLSKTKVEEIEKGIEKAAKTFSAALDRLITPEFDGRNVNPVPGVSFSWICSPEWPESSVTEEDRAALAEAPPEE